MRRIGCRLICIALILITFSGCSSKSESTPTIPNGASSTPIISISDEKRNSMQSGGLFAKNGNVLIYVGDTGNIYMVDTKTNENRLLVKCLRPERLYFDGTYVYYMPSYQIERGIFRVSLKGESKKISPNSSIQLWLTDDKIYFTDQIGFDEMNRTPQGNLCSMNKDGSNIQVVIKNIKNNFYILDQSIYYTDLSSRSLYRAKLDGSDPQLLARGRTYIHTFLGRYGIYSDYATGETKHLFNVLTSENIELGQFGVCLQINGETYIETREKGSDGKPSMTDWSILQVNKESGKTNKLASLNISNVGIDMMQYVSDGWAYRFSPLGRNGSKAGTYRVKLSSDTHETEFVTDQYLNYLDGYGYYVDQNESRLTTGLSRINLKTKEITAWSLQ